MEHTLEDSLIISCTRETHGYLYHYVATYGDGTRRTIMKDRRCFVEVAQFSAAYAEENFRFSITDGGTPKRHPITYRRPLAVVSIEEPGWVAHHELPTDNGSYDE